MINLNMKYFARNRENKFCRFQVFDKWKWEVEFGIEIGIWNGHVLIGISK